MPNSVIMNSRCQPEPKLLITLLLSSNSGKVSWHNDTIVHCSSQIIYAQPLRGTYSYVEAIDTKDLYDYAARMYSTDGFARAVAVLDFADECMTKVKAELVTIRNAFDSSRIPKVKKHMAVLKALLAVVDDKSMAAVELILQRLPQECGAVVYRRELFGEMKRAVHASLEEMQSAWLMQPGPYAIGHAEGAAFYPDRPSARHSWLKVWNSITR